MDDLGDLMPVDRLAGARYKGDLVGIKDPPDQGPVIIYPPGNNTDIRKGVSLTVYQSEDPLGRGQDLILGAGCSNDLCKMAKRKEGVPAGPGYDRSRDPGNPAGLRDHPLDIPFIESPGKRKGGHPVNQRKIECRRIVVCHSTEQVVLDLNKVIKSIVDDLPESSEIFRCRGKL